MKNIYSMKCELIKWMTLFVFGIAVCYISQHRNIWFHVPSHSLIFDTSTLIHTKKHIYVKTCNLDLNNSFVWCSENKFTLFSVPKKIFLLCKYAFLKQVFVFLLCFVFFFYAVLCSTQYYPSLFILIFIKFS